jgi:hypothetical protein
MLDVEFFVAVVEELVAAATFFDDTFVFALLIIDEDP